MKTQHCDFTQATLVRAVQLALLAMFAAPGLALADEEEGDTKALVCPTNYLEIGAINVSQGSPKFGEYNGMKDASVYAMANVALRGGDGNCQKGGALRWQVDGKDLGTTSRSLSASVAEQGKWKVGLSFDEMRHYTTTGYQTPFLGSPGDNNFRLPAGFGALGATITNAQRPFMRDVDVYNKRQNYGINGSYALNDEWGVKIGFKRIEQSGAKLFGANASSGSGSLLMNPTEYQTNMFNVALSYVGDSAYADLEYRNSLFSNDNKALITYNNSANNTATYIGVQPPDNSFHQINLAGGYIFSRQTKLTGGLSYSRNYQTQNFADSYSGTVTLPRNDLDGDVRNTHADLRLTHQFTSSLNFTAGYKYNERDNKTDAYRWYPTSATAGGRVNAPLSNERQQFDAKLTWRIDKRQRVDLGYEYEKIKRWCNDKLFKTAPGQAYTAAQGNECVQVPESDENRFIAGYKLAILDTVNFNASYTYADRDADVSKYWAPILQTGTNHLNAPGFTSFFEGSRRQNVVKTGVTWQVSHHVELGLNARHSEDDYYDADTIGVRSGKTTGFDLFANFNPSADTSYGAWASFQRRDRDMRSSTSNANLNNIWGDKLNDKDNSVGLFGKQQLMHGKLVFKEDFSYSDNKTWYKTRGVKGSTLTSTANGSTPDIRSILTQLRLDATYQYDKTSSFSAGYLYQKLKSNDYWYYAYEAGHSIGFPTNLQEPNYHVDMVYLAYRYSFQ